MTGTSTSTPPVPKPKRKLWYNLLLFCSLALNIFFIGAIAATFWRFGGKPPQRAGIAVEMRHLMSALPPERRAELRETFEEMRPVFREHRKGHRALQRGLMDAIAADPFDPETVRALQMKLLGSHRELTKFGIDRFAEILSQMTPEERRMLAERMRRRGHRRHRSERHRRGEEG